MGRDQTITATTYASLAIVAVLSFALPGSLRVPGASAQAGPAELTLAGIVRDFSLAHPDFAIAPTEAYDYCAGTVAPSLDAASRPVLAAAGFRVMDQWTDSAGRPIPPHLSVGAKSGVVQVANPPVLDVDVTLDTWDSTEGAYDPLTAGPAPVVEVGATMPTITEPVLAPSVGDIVLPSGTNWTVDADIHCDALAVGKLSTIRVTGHVTILCEGVMTLSQDTRLVVDEDASLALYLKRGGTINQGSRINMSSWDPTRLTIYNLGSGATEGLTIAQGNAVCATIVSPDAPVKLAQNDQVFGMITAETLVMQKASALHVDSFPSIICGVVTDDDPGTDGGPSTGSVSSASSFQEWFRDVPGTNLSGVHRISLVDVGGGVYECLDDDFHPVDDRLLGNESQLHNAYFTYEFTLYFVHRRCDGTFVEFEGGDGAWMFVDGELALDLGGLATSGPQFVEMDRLRLTDGETYQLRFFYASRTAATPQFRLRHNLDVVGQPTPLTVSAVGD